MKYQVQKLDGQIIVDTNKYNEAVKKTIVFLIENQLKTIEEIKTYQNSLLLTVSELEEKIYSSSMDQQRKEAAIKMLQQKKKIDGSIKNGDLRYDPIGNDLWVRSGLGIKVIEQNFFQKIQKENLIRYFFDINENDVIAEDEEYLDGNSHMKVQPLNQILYGPPGTGKTYNTITKALEIIDGNIPSERTEAKAKFEEYRKSGQIEFVTFHQSYGYEEFVEGIRAKTSDKGIEYAIEAGIFKKLTKVAAKNIEQTKENTIIKKDFDVIFKEKILDKLLEDEKLEIKMKKSSFFIKEVDETHIGFDKSGGDSQHVLLIKNLKVMYETGENKIIMGGLSQYYNPLLEYLLYNNEIKNEEKEPLKNYILIIDEINRGNISKIFGELITLIEPSKRIGADEAIKLSLPYSNEEFGVPQNLYIIGTMNTADRSIALMDTALRRRFHFEEMMPNLEMLNDSMIEGIELKKILLKINQRVEYLYDRDHTIGHAYFINVKSKDDLDNVMRNKIFPLLQEYFYDDWEKIRMVLGDGFIDKIEVKSDIFDYKPDEYLEDEKFIYSIKESFDYTKFQS